MAKTKLQQPDSITFTIESPLLARAVDAVGSAVGQNPLLPIMEDIHFVLDNTECIVEATDLQMWRTDHFPFLSGIQANFTLPHKALRSLLDALKPQTLTITLDRAPAEGQHGRISFQATIKHSKGKLVLPSQDGRDFPVVEKGDMDVSKTTFKFKPSDLIGAIAHTQWAQHTGHDPRPWMTSHMLALSAGKINVYTSNGGNMASISMAAEYQGDPVSLFAPKAITRALIAFLKGRESLTGHFNKKAVVLYTDESIFGFILPETPMTEESFLSYIPKDQTILLQISAAEVCGALRRMLIGSMETTQGKTGTMQIFEDSEKMHLSGSQANYGTEADETCEITPVELQKDLDFKCGMNFSMFMEGLAAAGAIQDNVLIKIVAPNKAIILHPVSRPDAFTLVMPLTYN